LHECLQRLVNLISVLETEMMNVTKRLEVFDPPDERVLHATS
jgi:hypothetical protein